ncbi:MAG: RidA family protein [Anaerolineae bacterium]|jgi:2-iminobutanoate/2-iminopropanoate deaminase
MTERRAVMAPGAPRAAGPYSHAIVAGDFVFTAGQAGLDPATRQLAEGIEAQTRQALRNVAAILEAAGTSMANVVKTTVFLANMDDFQAMNAVYAEFFPENPPARTTVQAARIPLDALVEIEAVAVRGK